MEKCVSREELRSRLIDVFSSQDEIYEIHLFGNEVSGEIDQYSDIDIIFCSNDPAQTQKKYLELLETISPVWDRLLLASQPYAFAEMVMLKGVSPYQKIDMSIVDRIEREAAFAPFGTVYRQQGEPEPNGTTLKVRTRKWDVTHMLNEYLFSIPRFTKCLFRKDYDLYRRWKGITNLLWVALYEKYFGWSEVTATTALKAHAAKKIYHALTCQDRERMDTVLPPSARMDVAASFEACTEFFIELLVEKAEHFNVPLRHAFIDHMKEFTRQELDRYCRLRE
jgi:predicted nucleotidyltransferase